MKLSKKMMIQIMTMAVVAITVVSVFSGVYTPAPKASTKNGNGQNAESFAAVSGNGNSKVTFKETGLPSGTHWSVQLGNSYSSTNTTNTAFNVANGTYSYFVYYSGYSGYIFHGHVTVSGLAQTVTVAFHSITFSETGSASGFDWMISLTNQTGYSDHIAGNSSSMKFYLANGNYSYSVQVENILVSGNIYNVASGYQVVNGNNPSLSYKFYKLVFSESGLPLSTGAYSWYVDLHNGSGLNEYVYPTGSSFNFYALKGNYTYSASYSYAHYPYSPLFIKSSWLNTSISTAASFKFQNITFNERGLPAGADWGVAAVNSSTRVLYGLFVSSSTTGNLYLLSGGYQYQSVVLSDGQVTYTNGTFVPLTVSNSAKTAPTITFKGIYNITFKESGLPSGMTWTITTNVGSFSTSSNAISLYIANGSYSYYPSNPTINDRLSSESFTVNGASKSIAVPFYALTFKETGLPLGTSWSATLFNSTIGLVTSGGSSTSEVQFYVTNATYSYSFSVYLSNSLYYYGYGNVFVNGTTPGSVTIKNAGRSQTVSFSLKPGFYLLTFTESGLPTNTNWQMQLSNTTGYYNYGSSSGTSIPFIVQNGTYSYRLYSGQTGKIKINGSNTVQNIYLGWLKYTTLSFVENGLANGTAWSVTMGNVTHTSNTTDIYFTEISGNYLFSVFAPSGYIAYPSSGEISLSGLQQRIPVVFQPSSNATVGYVSRTISLFGGRVTPGDYYQNLGLYPQVGMFAYDSANEMVYLTQPYFVVLINSTTSVMSLFIFSGLNHPLGITYDSTNGNMYVANVGSDSIGIINTTSNRVVGQIPMGGGSQPVTVTYDKYNNELYAYDAGTGNISAVNISSGRIMKNIPISAMPMPSYNYRFAPSMLSYDPNNGNVFVVNQVTDNLTVINASSNSILKNVSLGAGNVPTGVTFIPSTNSIYVTGSTDNVTVFNANNLSFERNISVPGGTTSMVYDSSNDYAYITGFSSAVFVVNTKNSTFLTSIPVGMMPYAMVFVPGSNNVYDLNAQSYTISEISQLVSKPVSIPPAAIYGVVAAVVVVAGAVGYMYYRRRKQ